MTTGTLRGLSRTDYSVVRRAMYEAHIWYRIRSDSRGTRISECRRPAQSWLLLQLAGSDNSIYPDTAVWKVGEPVRVIVTMINQTEREVHYTLTNPGMDWEMDVRDSAGKGI